jgi:hypothetical protein
MAKEKNKYEFNMFSRFCDLYKYEGIIQQSESPDFLIHIKNQVIGVEITTIFSETKRQIFESKCTNILKKVSTIWINNKYPFIEAHFHFTRKVKSINKLEEDSLALFISTVLFQNIPANGEIKSIDNISTPYIHGITLINLNTLEKPYFLQTDSEWITDLDFFHVQNNINRKIIKYTSYLKKCDIAWLILVVNNTKLSTDYSIPKQTLIHLYNSPFEKTFILDYFNRNYYELQISNFT